MQRLHKLMAIANHFNWKESRSYSESVETIESVLFSEEWILKL